MILAVALNEVISDNFTIIILLVFLLLIVYIVAHAVVKIKEQTVKKTLVQAELESKKVDAISNRYKTEELREAAVLLTDDEREKIEGIKMDKGVLARRSIALMNELEERTARLERGIENTKLEKTLREIKEQEGKLFKKIEGK